MVNRKGKRVDFYLDDESYEKMMKLCNIHSVNKSDFLRKAVKNFIKLNINADVNRAIEQEIKNQLGIRQ